MMDKKLEELINWKTGAWQDASMVSWYAGRMVENSGTNQLKNAVEVGLFDRFVAGQNILDVGIGTGRASIPLLQKGLRVSGIDSSQAMLDECRRQAGGLPMELRVGDICALPFQAEKFDSLISLNVMTHFPHWREVLSEWRRVVKPGGRIVFDIYSLDHLHFVEGRAVTVEELVERGAGAFNMHLAVSELFEFADEAGLSIAAIVPYGSVFSGHYRRFNAAAPLSSLNWWQRHLSWLSVDKALFDALLFMERNFFACLTSKMTGRYMAVLDNKSDKLANHALRKRFGEIDSLLAGQVTLENLAPYLTIHPGTWKQELARHTASLRSRVVIYLLLTSCLGRSSAIDFVSFFDPAVAAEMASWLRKETFDWTVHQVIEGWHAIPELGAIISRNGLPIEACLEYELTRGMIVNKLRADSGNE